MATDGFVQVAADGSGKKVDTSELTRPDTTVVERQRVIVPDPVTVTGDMLASILLELRMQSYLLAELLPVKVDLDRLRDDLNVDLVADNTD